jgi:hypothetical protein
MSLMGAIVVIVGINLAMPSDTPPADTNRTGQDVYAVVTAPFRAIRWFINEVSPALIFVGLVPLALGVLFLIVGHGVARYRLWARIAGAALLLVPVLFGALAIMGGLLDHDYDMAAYTLPLVLVPLYPLWLIVWKWNVSLPGALR